MAKKNFKGGLDSLIENSLGIKKSRKGEMKGNPVDLIKPEQTDENDEVLAKPRTPQKPVPVVVEETLTEDTETKAEIKKTETPEPNIKESTATEKATESTAAQTPQSTQISEPEVSTPITDENDIESIDDEQPTPQPQQSAPQPQQSAPQPVVTQQSAPQTVITMSLDASDDDNSKIAYLKEVIADLRHELFLWRNGTINVQTFNATLHTHGLKYNPENNEIEEFDTI